MLWRFPHVAISRIPGKTRWDHIFMQISTYQTLPQVTFCPWKRYFGAMLNPLGQSIFCNIFPELPSILAIAQYPFSDTAMFHHARDPQPPTPTPSHCQGHRQGAMRTVPAAVPMFAHQQKTIQNQHLDCEFADGKGATVGLPKNERLARFVAMGYWSCKSCLLGINALLQATEPLNHATLPTKLLGSQGIPN